jgi:hypothetical protein
MATEAAQVVRRQWSRIAEFPHARLKSKLNFVWFRSAGCGLIESQCQEGQRTHAPAPHSHPRGKVADRVSPLRGCPGTGAPITAITDPREIVLVKACLGALRRVACAIGLKVHCRQRLFSGRAARALPGCCGQRLESS